MRRRERGELATEGLTAFTLLNTVQVAYAHNEMDGFVLLNAVAAVALAAVVIRGVIRIRQQKDVASTGVNLVGVFGGLVAVTEGVNRLHAAQFTPGHKHFALGVLTVFAGLLTASIGVMAERLENRRALSMTDDGISMRLNKFRRFSVRWTDLVELQMSAGQARLVCVNGSARVVPLGRLVNRDEVSEALVDAARSRGVKVSTIAESTPVA
jgi:hypothetical protein